MAFYTILEQISILALLAVIGIIAVKTGILNHTANSVIEKLVFYITLPLLIITKISSLDLTTEILKNGIKVILITYLILLLQIVLGRLSSKLLKLKKAQAIIHQLHTAFGNIVFLGFPLLDALFPGGEAILYAALYQLVMNTVIWTYGVSQLSIESGRSKFINLSKLLNPNTIALLIALIMLVLHIKLPTVLDRSLGGLGSTTLYLAMIYIGVLLSKTNFISTIRKRDVLILSFNKLIFIPAMLIAVFYLLLNHTPLQINFIVIAVLVLEASMPCMTILVLLAKRYGADDHKAMENFVVSTVLSLISLPLILGFLQYLKV